MFYIFYALMLSAVFLFSIGLINVFSQYFCFPLASFSSIFIDIASYACKKTDENKLNIKQKY